MKFSWFWNPLFLLCSALPSQAGEVDPLESWQREVLKAVREEAISPNLAVRNFAILNGAVFDALNSIDARWKPYHFDERPEEKNLLPELIVSGTCHTIAINLHPSRKGAFGHLLESHKKEFSGNAPVESSLSLGKRAAHSFLKLRESDGASTTLTYYPRLETGQWRRTPPRQRPPEQPHWRKVKPFCLPNLKEFLPIPPPSLGSPQYVTAVKEVKMLGAKKSTLRTSEQTLIAKFWKDFSYTATPPRPLERDRRLRRAKSQAVTYRESPPLRLAELRLGRCGHRGLGKQIPLPSLAADPRNTLGRPNTGNDIPRPKKLGFPPRAASPPRVCLGPQLLFGDGRPPLGEFLWNGQGVVLG